MWGCIDGGAPEAYRRCDTYQKINLKKTFRYKTTEHHEAEFIYTSVLLSYVTYPANPPSRKLTFFGIAAVGTEA